MKYERVSPQEIFRLYRLIWGETPIRKYPRRRRMGAEDGRNADTMAGLLTRPAEPAPALTAELMAEVYKP